MVHTTLLIVSILIQLLILYIVLPRKKVSGSPPQDGEAKKKPRRIITPSGVFTVESKRTPKINDDEALYEREQEKR